MKPVSIRRVVRTVFLSYLGIGLVLAMVGFFPPASLDRAPPVAGMIATAPTPERAMQAYLAQLSAVSLPLLRDGGGATDAAARCRAAFQLARLSVVRRHAIAAVESCTMAAMDDPESEAHLGAAYALRARDFVVIPWTSFFAGVGLPRLWFSWQTVRHLDAALDRAPDSPVVRMLRASTYAQLPGLFGTAQAAERDRQWLAARLAGLTGGGQPGERLADVSPAAQAEAVRIHMLLANAAARDGQVAEARDHWAAVATLAPAASPEQEIARWMVSHSAGAS